LKGTLQLLQRRVQHFSTRTEIPPSEIHAFLANCSERLTGAVRQVDVQTHVINDLLDVSRIATNILQMEREPCDLVSVVRETIADLRLTALSRSLLLAVPEHLTLMVLADRYRIGQVVRNYVTNALRYAPADQPIQIGLSAQEQSARVWVQDRGPGLSKEEQEEVWQRFRQVKGGAAQGGSEKGLGLGLYLCQMLIAAHQGQIGVESTPGEGSTFWFTLPLIP
ncbi:MAG: sensor histidine kinase, partial [Ktedonobacteraceae bacterium]